MSEKEEKLDGEKEEEMRQRASLYTRCRGGVDHVFGIVELCSVRSDISFDHF